MPWNGATRPIDHCSVANDQPREMPRWTRHWGGPACLFESRTENWWQVGIQRNHAEPSAMPHEAPGQQARSLPPLPSQRVAQQAATAVWDSRSQVPGEQGQRRDWPNARTPGSSTSSGSMPCRYRRCHPNGRFHAERSVLASQRSFVHC